MLNVFFLTPSGLVESDSWGISEKCEKTQILRNRKNHILIARPGDRKNLMAVVEPVTDHEIQTGTVTILHLSGVNRFLSLP